MTVRDKNHQYQQKMTFWNLICKYVFLKSDEKVTRNMIFLCFCVFSKKRWAPLTEKNVFAKCTKSFRCLHFGRFKAINSETYKFSESALFGLIRNYVFLMMFKGFLWSSWFVASEVDPKKIKQMFEILPNALGLGDTAPKMHCFKKY